MKESTLNKIHRILSHMWVGVIAIGLVYGIYYVLVLFIYNEPIIHKYHTIENTKVIYKELGCSLDGDFKRLSNNDVVQWGEDSMCVSSIKTFNLKKSTIDDSPPIEIYLRPIGDCK